jgi:class 3 adenylate cyclase
MSETCERELAKPRIEQAPNLRLTLENMLAMSLIVRGDVRRGSAISPEALMDWTFVEPEAALWSGDLDTAETLWRRSEEVARSRGDEITPNGCHWYLAFIGLHRGEGDPAQLESDLIQHTENGAVWPEVTERSLLAEIHTHAGRLERAHEHLARCREILASDDHGAKVGLVARAEGRLAAAEERWNDADKHLGYAVEIFDRADQVWEAAQALHTWGRALLAAGEHARATDKLSQALDIYRRYEAGSAWTEPVLVDKMSAQGIDPSSMETSIDAVVSIVGAERPDLRPHASPDGTVAILFSDIEGSTQMAEALGDERWLGVVRRHNEIVRDRVGAHGGTEVKALGDGFMLAFPTSAKAVACAVDIQRAFAGHNTEYPGEQVRIRVGVHSGLALREGEDFYGKTVILAARIAAEARGGEILVSSDARAQAGEVTTDDARIAELKGLSGRHDLFRIAWSA